VSQEAISAIRTKAELARRLSGETRDPAAKAALLGIASLLDAEPAWDILLHLLRAELAHERISVSSACIAAAVPPSSGLRWLKALERKGLVLLQCDARDATRTFVVLSPDTSKALRRYFIEVAHWIVS